MSVRQPSELVEDKTALGVTLEPQSLVPRKDSHIYLWGERYRKFYIGSAWKKGKRERRDFETPVLQGQGCLSLILASIGNPEDRTVYQHVLVAAASGCRGLDRLHAHRDSPLQGLLGTPR